MIDGTFRQGEVKHFAKANAQEQYHCYPFYCQQYFIVFSSGYYQQRRRIPAQQSNLEQIRRRQQFRQCLHNSRTRGESESDLTRDQIFYNVKSISTHLAFQVQLESLIIYIKDGFFAVVFILVILISIIQIFEAKKNSHHSSSYLCNFLEVMISKPLQSKHCWAFQYE